MSTALNLVVGEPTNAKIVAYGGVEGSAVDLGATEGGLKLSFNSELFMKKADQWLGSVGAVKISEDLKCEVMLAEITLVNLAYALGYPQSAISGGNTLNIGGNTAVGEWTLFVNGRAPSDPAATRKITLWKCVVLSAVEYEMKKDNKTLLKLTLQILQDTSKSANQQLMAIVDLGLDTTPPTVAMDTPAEDGTVATGTTNPVIVAFTEAGAGMDEGSMVINESVIVENIEDPTATVALAGTLSYATATKKLTFTPTAAWGAAGQNYKITLTRSVKDMAGNKLAAVFTGHFTAA